MKLNRILTLALALFAVAAVSQDKPQARTHSVIMLQARAFYQYSQNGPPDANGNRGYIYNWMGLSVYNVDCSLDLRTNLPLPGYLVTPTLNDAYIVEDGWTNSLSVRTAEILAAGYRQTGQSGDAYTVTVTFTK